MVRIPIRSSMATSVGHEGFTLEVELSKGELYRYEPVTKAEYEVLLTAPSFGEHLNKAIKPGRDCWKLVKKAA